MKSLDDIKKIKYKLISKGIKDLHGIEMVIHNEEEFYKYTAMAFTVLSVMSNLGIKANEHIVHTNNGDYIKGKHLDIFLPVRSIYDFKNTWVDLDKVEVVQDEDLIAMLNMLDD